MSCVNWHTVLCPARGGGSDDICLLMQFYFSASTPWPLHLHLPSPNLVHSSPFILLPLWFPFCPHQLSVTLHSNPVKHLLSQLPFSSWYALAHTGGHFYAWLMSAWLDGREWDGMDVYSILLYSQCIFGVFYTAGTLLTMTIHFWGWHVLLLDAAGTLPRSILATFLLRMACVVS